MREVDFINNLELTNSMKIVNLIRASLYTKAYNLCPLL
jgi:hypothetical protein